MLEAEGAVPVQFPVLSIEPLADSEALDPGFAGLAEQQLVIFTSPNAVHCCLELMQQRGLSWPDGPEVAARGRATAEALEKWKIPVAVCPDGPYTSEGLLAHPRMHQTADQRTLLVRGIGGREVLAETLRERGARVSTLEVYRRTRPDADPAPLMERWQRGGIQVVVVTSLEGLDNLLALVGPDGREALLGSGLVTVSGRVATAARVRGFTDGIVVAPEASDAGLVEGLVNWRKKHGNGGVAMKDEDNNKRQTGETSGDTNPPPALPGNSEGGDSGRGGDGRETTADSGSPRSAAGLAALALVLLLILAAVVAAGGWWLYERLQALESSQEGLVTDLELAELRDSAVSSAERLAGRVDNLAAEHQSHVRDLARAEEAMQQVRQSQGRVDERMERLEELAAAHRDDWIRSEVDYLYGMARHRLE
ncbi:MAG: uroporphyrinogen-III synthase, partial [Ectothiorhodospiraceae bacterium]|nr:uroporphyrinogen-III synthase [Ectothiorhodospiraceae bacterium]